MECLINKEPDEHYRQVWMVYKHSDINIAMFRDYTKVTDEEIKADGEQLYRVLF